jgi:hypothetical protein
MCVHVSEQRSASADAAEPPEPAAAATAAATPATTSAASAPAVAASAAPAPTAAAAASMTGELHPRRSGVFLIKHVEGGQTDVRDLFLIEGDLTTWQRHFVLRRDIGHGSICRGRSPRQRQRYANET